MKRTIAFVVRSSTIAMLLLAAGALAQGTRAQESPPASERPFTASLLLIKADWSKSPDVLQIDADLRTALSGERLDEKLSRDSLAARGSTLLFPVEAASIYTRENYRQLIAWLKHCHLLESQESFAHAKPAPDPRLTWEPKVSAYLQKDADSLGIEPKAPRADAFFTRQSIFSWGVVGEASRPAIGILRELKSYETARGEQEFKRIQINGPDTFTPFPLEENQVAILHAFPAQFDAHFREQAAGKKNLLALIVIERAASPAAADPTAEARVALPDRIVRIESPAPLSGSMGAAPTAAAAPDATPSGADSVTASLPLVKSDWSKSPAANEINAEMRKAIEGVEVPKELIDKLPASGPQVIFPPGVAGMYSAKDYSELLAWLEAKGLYQDQKPFGAEKGILRMETGGGRAGGGISEYFAKLTQPIDFLNMPALSDVNESKPFIVRRPEFQWFAIAATMGRNNSVDAVRVERELTINVKELGEDDFRPLRTLDATGFRIGQMQDGYVWITNTFPDRGDSRFHQAAHEKGIEVLLVIAKNAKTPPDASAKFHLPTKVQSVSSTRRISFAWPGAGGMALPAYPAFGSSASTPAATTAPDAQRKGAEATTETKPDGTQIKIFTLRNARASAAERMITQLFARDVHSITADERTNSLIVRGPPAELNVIFHILTRLDAAELAGPPDQSATPYRPTWQPPSGLTPAELDQKSIDELRATFESKERQTAQLSREIQRLQAAQPRDNKQLEKLNTELKSAVAESFAANQYLRHKENGEIFKRTFPIAQTLEQRFRVADQIIDRRIKDLLNPDLRWESASRPPGGTSQAVQSTNSAPMEKGPASADLQADEVERVWKILGIKVRPVTRGENEIADIGAFVTEIRPHGPADGPSPLRVGDIVTQLGDWEITSPGRLHFALSLKLGDLFPMPTGEVMQKTGLKVSRKVGNTRLYSVIEIVFPFLAQDQQTAKVPSSGRNLQPAEAIRDIYRDNVQRAEKDFQAGKLSKQGLMWAKWQLADAEYKAAAVPANRLAEKEAMVEYLKANVTWFEQRLAAGTGNQADVASAQVALLKAEEEFATEKSKQLQPEAAGQPTDLSAALAYRDKVRERVELLKRGYSAGEMPYVDCLRAVIQLDDAEISAAASAEDRKKAQQAKVDHLKEVKTAVETMFRAGEINQTEVLSAEAELLKAEAELAAKADASSNESGRSSESRLTPQTYLGSAAIPDRTTRSLTIRSAAEFSRDLRDAENLLFWAKRESIRNQVVPVKSPERMARDIADAEGRLAVARAEYAAQIRLLELEVQDAQSAVSTAHEQQRAAGRDIGKSLEAERAREAARFRLERAKTLLELYRKADPKQPAAEPPAAGSTTEPAK